MRPEYRDSVLRVDEVEEEDQSSADLSRSSHTGIRIPHNKNLHKNTTGLLGERDVWLGALEAEWYWNV